jgi:hypothetical protein
MVYLTILSVGIIGFRDFAHHMVSGKKIKFQRLGLSLKCYVSFGMPDERTSENPVFPSIIYHNQNPLESNAVSIKTR